MVSSNGDGFEMPSYNIRHSIANKVAAKKTEKGYTLSEENCTECEMPLMIMNGKSECKTCPAIKKWVQRKNEENNDQTEDVVVVDERETVESVARGGDEEEERETEMRDDPPACESIAASGSYESVNSHLVKVQSTGSEDSDDSGRYLSSADSDESEDTEAIRARARQIILGARKNGGWADSDDEDDDDDSDMKYPQSSMESTYSMEEDASIRNRAGEIMKQAREEFQSESVSYSEEEALEINANSTSISIGRADPPAMETTSSSVSVDAPAMETTSTRFSVDNYAPDMESWAAVIIQALARRFLARKVFIGMMLREYSKEPIVVEEETTQFESLGINNTTGDEYDEDWENEPVEEEHVDDMVQQQQEPEAMEQHEPEDVAEECRDDVQEQEHYSPDAPEDDAANDPPEDIANDDAIGGAEEAAGNKSTDQQSEIAVAKSNSLVDDKSAVVHPQCQQQRAAAPQRGFFADLACKFDDAVTDAIGKVHSVVTCSAMGEPGSYPEGSLAEAFEAEQFKMGHDLVAGPSSSGQIRYDHAQASSQDCHDKYNEQIMLLTMNGWRVANASCNRCNRAFMIRPEDGQMMCAACDDIEGDLAPTCVPAVTHQYAVNAPAAPFQQLAINQASPHPESNFDTHRANQVEMDRRLHMGLVAGATTMANYTPLGAMNHNIAHQQVSAAPNANPLRDVTAAHYGTAARTSMATPMPPTVPVPSTQQYTDPRDECPLSPNENQVNAHPCQHNTVHIQNQMQDMNIHGADDDAKENAPGDANISKELNDAKTRIDNAKKFIMSRRQPTFGMPPHIQQMHNMTPGAQQTVFRPQMSMMTPASQAATQPMMKSMTPGAYPTSNSNNFGPQMNMITTPGAQVRAPTPEMRAMGSLMSPGSESNANALNKIAQVDQSQQPQMSEMMSPCSAQGDAEGGHDGYRTPQMPGKYFFA